MASRKSSLVSLLFCFLLAAVASASVEDICRKIVVLKHASVKYDFCVRILKSDPASATADERGIAVIAGNIGSKTVQKTLSKINGLLKSAPAPMAAPLQDCRLVYNKMVDTLAEAAADAKAGNYAVANVYFSSGMDAAGTCGDGFAQKKLRSPLGAENSDLSQICAIGTALTHTGP